MKKTHVGITGATGFVGRHLVDKLLSEKCGVKALAVGKTPNLPKNVEIVKGDLITGEGIARFLKNVDVVVHLAARVTSPEEEMFQGNTSATYNLVKNCLNSSVNHVVFTSSVAVYGKSESKKYSEGDGCQPDTMYGLSKILAERILEYWVRKKERILTVFRPFNIYGPGNKKGIIYSFCKDIEDKNSVVVYGSGKQRRDFLYIDDLIEILTLAIDKKIGGVYNLGFFRKYSILDMLSIFENILGRKIKVKFDTREKGKVFNINQDLSLVKKVFGWEAKIPLEEGIKRTISWYQKDAS